MFMTNKIKQQVKLLREIFSRLEQIVVEWYQNWIIRISRSIIKNRLVRWAAK